MTSETEHLRAGITRALWLLEHVPNNPNAFNSALVDEAIDVLRATLETSHDQ